MRWLRSGALTAVLALAPTAANAVPLPLGHWELLRRDVPATLLPGARIDVPVRIRNRSDREWSEATRDRLAYHWRYPDGTMAVQEGERTHLPAPLAPGESVDLVLHVTAPTEPGRYYLQIEPVREMRRWWGLPYLGRDLLIPVEVTGGDLSWSIGQVAQPPPIAPGRRTTIPIRLTNDGDTTWSPSAGDRLSHHILDPEGRRSEGVRTRLPGPVPPHTTVDLDAEILAPTTPGPHRVIWEPVREHVRWYGPPRSGTPTTELLITDTREHIIIDPPPLTIHAQTIADIDVLVRNAGDDLPEDHGLLLSYHWRTPDGAILEFEGQRTPLPPLAPGEEALVPARLRGPERPGEHQLEWALVREDVGCRPCPVRWCPDPVCMSALAPDDVALMSRHELLRAAETVLLDAQTINPLNTDHTANLARLYRTWADLAAADPVERQAKLDQSDTTSPLRLVTTPSISRGGLTSASVSRLLSRKRMVRESG